MYILYSLVIEMCCNAVPACGESESENQSVRILVNGKFGLMAHWYNTLKYVNSFQWHTVDGGSAPKQQVLWL